MMPAKRLFAVTSIRGAALDGSRPLEEQHQWTEHAAFMDALVDDGFVLLGGPLEGTSEVLLVVRAGDEAEIRSRLSADPWMRADLLRIVSVTRWQLRLGSLG
jgi:uncharacterized protein YciI